MCSSPTASQPSSEPAITEHRRGSLIGCSCPRYVRRPYALLALRLTRLDEGAEPALELSTPPADGTIVVFHDELEVAACESR